MDYTKPAQPERRANSAALECCRVPAGSTLVVSASIVGRDEFGTSRVEGW